jgi:hypothetical protein
MFHGQVWEVASAKLNCSLLSLPCVDDAITSTCIHASAFAQQVSYTSWQVQVMFPFFVVLI